MKKYYLLFLYFGFFFAISAGIHVITSKNESMFMTRVYISIILFSVGYIGFLLENYIDFIKNKK